MINSGILNPRILSLLARVRHTNALVIADRGFPFWPEIETVDVSVVDDVPTVLQTLAAILKNFNATQAFMAREFQKNNSVATRAAFAKGLAGVPVKFEPARPVQEAHAQRNRVDPHRRYNPIRKFDFDLRLKLLRFAARGADPRKRRRQ